MLTDEQKALLGLLCKGLGDKQIAQRFHITRQAVAMRVLRLKARFGATTRAQLVHRAYATGVLVVPPQAPVRVVPDPPEVIAARRRVLLGEDNETNQRKGH